MTTTIQVTNDLHEKLKEMKEMTADDFDGVIRQLLAVRECPKCGEKLHITRSYMFEPLFFDLKCSHCGHRITRWRVPFNGGDR